MKNDMAVYAELLDNGNLMLQLSGMSFKSKLKVIKQVLMKNKITVYLTTDTVHDLKDLFKRAAQALLLLTKGE